MRTTFLLLGFICLTCTSIAQRKVRLTIGPEFSLPAYKEFPSNGIGGSIAVEFRSKNRFSATIETGYNHFWGSYVNVWKHDTTRGFSFVPILAGARYSAGEKFYASMRAGLTLGTTVGFTLSPAAGVVLPNRRNPKIDLGVRLIGVVGMPSIPENSFLDRGGFSYLNFRIAVVL